MDSQEIPLKGRVPRSGAASTDGEYICAEDCTCLLCRMASKEIAITALSPLINRTFRPERKPPRGVTE